MLFGCIELLPIGIKETPRAMGIGFADMVLTADLILGRRCLVVDIALLISAMERAPGLILFGMDCMFSQAVIADREGTLRMGYRGIKAPTPLAICDLHCCDAPSRRFFWCASASLWW